MSVFADVGAVHAIDCLYLADPPEACNCGVPAELGRLLSMNTALNKVLDLHQPKEYIHADGRTVTGCAECWTANNSPRPYPCRTIQRLLEGRLSHHCRWCAYRTSS